jgi:hypothetical protein
MNNVPAAATLFSTTPDVEGRNFSKAKKTNGMDETAIACSTSHLKRFSGAVDIWVTLLRFTYIYHLAQKVSPSQFARNSSKGKK